MAERNFIDLLQARQSLGFSITVGLDPDIAKFPKSMQGVAPATAVLEFCRIQIEATASVAAAFKPNSAFFEALGDDGFAVLRQVIEFANDFAAEVPVLLDAKRADIGNTNDKQASAIFDQLRADAVTVHPYLGPEAMQPYIERKDKGVFVLARTSNPGAGRYQDLQVNGCQLFQYIAKDVADVWNTNGNCGLVVGATYPNEMKLVREVAPSLPILVPGIGAQGGDLLETLRNGLDKRQQGLLINAGRSIMYAFDNTDSVTLNEVQETSSAAANLLHEQIVAAKEVIRSSP